MCFLYGFFVVFLCGFFFFFLGGGVSGVWVGFFCVFGGVFLLCFGVWFGLGF